MDIVIRVSAVLVQDKKLLLCKRSKKKDIFPGQWGLPGATFKKGGKPLVEFIADVVKDRTGFEFEPTQKLWFYETITKKQHIITHIYLGKHTGDLDLNVDHIEDHKWFSFDELEGLDLAFSYWEVAEDLNEEGII